MAVVHETHARHREDRKNVEIWDSRCKLTKEVVDIGRFLRWIRPHFELSRPQISISEPAHVCIRDK